MEKIIEALELVEEACALLAEHSDEDADCIVKVSGPSYSSTILCSKSMES